MSTAEKIRSYIIAEAAEVTDRSAVIFTAETQLIGPESQIKSHDLVRLLLALEDYIENEFGVEFDWSSDSAFSTARSSLRTVQTLANHLSALVDPG